MPSPHPVLVLTDEAMIAHDPGPGHPERPDRLRAVLGDLRARPIDGLRWASPTPAPRAALERVHDAAHLDRLDRLDGTAHQLDPDTATSPASVHAARLAAGALIDGVQAVFDPDTTLTQACALVRPPGHHAERDRAMGFCLLNNVAVAAAAALALPQCARVLVFDWDVHHGNGTQHTFAHRDDVLVVNLHQHPYYPGTGDLHRQGHGAGLGHNVNIPLPPGAGDGDLRVAVTHIVAPIARAFRPDLVLISAGFDADARDPLASFRFTPAGFATACALMRDLARTLCGGRIILTLEGGYHLNALTEGVRACLQTLTAPSDAEAPRTQTTPVHADALRAACAAHRTHWPDIPLDVSPETS